MDKAQKAYDELKKGIQNYIKISLDNVPMDKTFTALIKSYGEEEGTYNPVKVDMFFHLYTIFMYTNMRLDYLVLV